MNIDDEVEQLMKNRRLSEEERERSRLTTLADLQKRSVRYAMNDATGELVHFDEGVWRTIMPAQSMSPDVLLNIVFDGDAVARSWFEISSHEANSFLVRQQ